MVVGMSEFKLVEALGVEVVRGHQSNPESPGYTEYVRAADLERALAQAPVVSTTNGQSWWDINKAPETATPSDTHTARLLCVQEIQRDTAEGLLRAFVDEFSKCDRGAIPVRYLEIGRKFYDRARKLLDGGK